MKRERSREGGMLSVYVYVHGQPLLPQAVLICSTHSFRFYMNALYQHGELFSWITASPLSCVFMQRSALEATVAIWKDSKPLTLSDHNCFPATTGFQHGALIYCRDDNKVLCCKQSPISTGWYLGNEVMVNLKGLTPKQLLMAGKSDIVLHFLRWPTNHYVPQ